MCHIAVFFSAQTRDIPTVGTYTTLIPWGNFADYIAYQTNQQSVFY